MRGRRGSGERTASTICEPYTPEVVLAADLIPRVLQIVLIDLVLSGDNAVVIGMAAQPLEPRQRRVAVVFGGVAAFALRVALTGAAALVLGMPALKAIGGVLLLWIAYRLLTAQADHTSPAKGATTLAGAIATILLADLIMSVDNVLGVAAASDGDFVLLIFGLLLSMAILMLGGSMFAEAVDRLWWLAYLGALVIAWTGVDLVLGDPMVEPILVLPTSTRWIVCGSLSALLVMLAHVAHRRLSALQRTPR